MTMDYITDLPKSKEPYGRQSFDAILVMVDRLTKEVILCATNRTLTASELITLLMDKLVKYNGFPEEIIADRDKLHTSKF